MYFPNVPSIIEADDIVSLLSSQVEQLENGTVVAHLVVELASHKQYDVAPSLHVTNGVSPRTLIPSPVPAPDPSAMSDAPVLDGETEPEVTTSTPSGGRRKARDERGE